MVLTPAFALDCSNDDSVCCPPYGHSPTPPFDAGEPGNDGAFAVPDGQAATPEAGDGSVDAGRAEAGARPDANTDASDAGSD